VKTTLIKPSSTSSARIDLYASEVSAPPKVFDCKSDPDHFRCSTGERVQGVNFNDFNAFGTTTFGNLTNIGGLIFSLPHNEQNLEVWGANGSPTGVSFSTNALYSDGGSVGGIDIRRADGGDFNFLSLDIGQGFSANPQDVWAIEFNNGVANGLQFFSTIAATTNVSFFNAVFDELRVLAAPAGFFSGQTDFDNQYQAASLDNVVFK
jgi:hypothetical protein